MTKLSEAFVIVGYDSPTAPPYIWSFYITYQDAEAALPHVSTQYKAGVKIIAYKDFEALQRPYYITGEIVEITKEQWWDKLEVLPPEAWERGVVFERFRMSEYLTGYYTRQYARLGERYFTAVIDVRDKSTWLTRLKIATYIRILKMSPKLVEENNDLKDRLAEACVLLRQYNEFVLSDIVGAELVRNTRAFLSLHQDRS